jgi:hypothetical protein
MTIYYPDIYNGQKGLRIQPGTVAVCAKASEGTYYHDPSYADFASQAAGVGAVFFAYHFLVGGNADQQADYCHAIVGNTPVMIDCEDTSTRPGLPDCLEFAAELRARGGTCSLLYLPHWYWQDHLGSPSLSPLVPAKLSLVSSAYTAYSDTGPGWTPYGGLAPAIWQYTDQQPYGGMQIDFNAFRGTAAQLAALVSGTGGAPPLTGVVEASPTLNVRSGPGPDHPVVGTVPYGGSVGISCWTQGAPVTATWQDGSTWTTDVWDRLAENINGGAGYVSDAWINTGGDTSKQISSCAS